MRNTNSFAGRLTYAISCAVLLSPLFITGCSDPRDYPITKLTEEQKKELGKKMTAEEGQKLQGWMVRNAISGGSSFDGVTVAQALKQQDEWIAKQKQEDQAAAELKKKIDSERKLKQEEFAKLITVALVGKKSGIGDYGKRWVVLEIAYENKSDKDIQGVKGILKITDIFGDKIMNIKWSFDEGVNAKKSFTEKNSGIDINQFMNDHMKLYNTDFDKLKSTFEVSTIIFKGGEKIDAP